MSMSMDPFKLSQWKEVNLNIIIANYEDEHKHESL